MEQDQAMYIHTQTILELNEEHNKLKAAILTQLEVMETKSEKVQKTIIRLEDEKLDQSVQIAELKLENFQLKEEVHKLKDEIQKLATTLSNQQLTKRNTIRDLDSAVNLLDKRRRLIAYSMDSPLSPSHPSDSNDDRD